MSTKETEKKDSSSPATENETNDNKKVFGPLGKYAVVAVIMVSIIVTTAIMLNKQLGSVEEQLAAMESEVAEINDANTTSTVTSEASEATSESQDVAEVAEIQPASVEVQAAEVQAVEAPSAEVLVAFEDTTKETVSETVISAAQDSATEAATIAPVMEMNAAEYAQGQLAMEKRDQEHQARIEAFKAEQKQHMTEMFARIKTLDAQRLDEYKIKQDEQVERLRQQIAKQEQLIEALILRNKEWIEMRAANMQRSQSNREKMLERI